MKPFRKRGSKTGRWFRALDDVSFDVEPGTALGIVGRNGAGKSTLLKILSRITKPTTGEIVLRGRVGSLLEVGTGFHPELTGRENVYMNGAILGMRKVEIDRKFDEIVAFAGVEPFLDTPVKRFSSGMYVRLAFAVAAHLEPEILLVDEVLAVGDADFQKKCLGRMEDVASQGRTVLFVSHNAEAIRQLTTKCVLMVAGQVATIGSTAATLESYLAVAGGALNDVDLSAMTRLDDSLGLMARLCRARLIGDDMGSFRFGERPNVEVSFSVRPEVPEIRFAYTLYRFDGTPVGTSWAPTMSAPKSSTLHTCRLTIEGPPLAPGSYYLALSLGRGDERSGPVEYDVIMETVHFTVSPPSTESGMVVNWNPRWGAIRLPDPTVVLSVESSAS